MREVVMNKKTNLLQLEEHFYQLADVKEPNVFHNLFPYDEIPKIAFNDRIVPHNMPENIWITDTTFRDGQQSRAPYTTEQIVTIYDYLHRLGGPKGLIRQSEFFLYSKKDRDAVYKCLERGYKFPEVTSWIRASKQDFQLVKDIGLRETGILVSCSDYHIFYKMKMTRREVMNLYLSVIRECLETGISPRCHLEDITRSDIYGFVIPFCVELMKLMDEYKIPIKIRACDTMGYGVNFPGAVIPRSVPGIIYGLTTHAGVPSELIEWHGHNDFYKAVNNSTTAWLYGASGVNCSLFGIGERTGIRSFITDRLLKPFYIFFRYMQPFRRCIFAHHQTGVDDFLFGSIVTDSACFLILHHISIKICRCGYDRFSFTAPDNLYCKVKYRHDTIPPFCRIRH